MPTRRHTLKTLAGASIVGSLSGCVELATNRTVEYHGTPAMVAETERGLAGTAGTDGVLASGAGVEARRVVERFGLEKELVAHSWGMTYGRYDMRGDTFFGAGLATVTTPSIEIAGRELNPIEDVTVADIGTELLATVRNGTAWPGRNAQPFTTSTIHQATGKKVLRAFRAAVGGDNQRVVGARETTDASSVEFDVDGDGTYDRTLEAAWPTTTPDWNGDTYDVTVRTTGETKPPTGNAVVTFQKHDGDFVILFGVSSDAQKGISFGAGKFQNATVVSDADQTSEADFTVVHPTDENFSQEVLHRHLAATNLQGARGMASQGRQLIDATRDLLEMGEYEKETLIQTVSNIQGTIGEVQETLQDCDSDACETVVRHAEDRSAHTRAALQALRNDNPGDARQSLQQVRAIIDEDIALLEAQHGNVAERALELERTLLDDTTRASLSAAQWQTLLSTHEALNQVDQLLSDVEAELSSVLGGAGTGRRAGDGLNRVREASIQTAEIATRAYEWIASYNDTRNEEDERFLQIERNLNGIMVVTKQLAAVTDANYAWYEGFS